MAKDINADQLHDAILVGDRFALARAITLVESRKHEDQISARKLIDRLLPVTGKSIRIGISGSPGVGKSTFIEALGNILVKSGKKIAVLAVDPSSSITHGSILGDKTRMEVLGNSELAYIRPTAAGITLGGVARNTLDAILLCEAAGFEIILIETVGVGQSETAVADMTDLFLLLLLPGAGDELQGIKRGIVEMADMVVVNKVDTDRVLMAKQTQIAYSHALHFFPLKDNGQKVPVLLCSALEGTGISEVWDAIQKYILSQKESGYFISRRNEQLIKWFEDVLKLTLMDKLYENQAMTTQVNELKTRILEGKIYPTSAAQNLVNVWIASRDNEPKAQ